MASNTLSVDPRLINPLVCNPEDGPGRFAGDTLHRCASLLELFGRLIESLKGVGIACDAAKAAVDTDGGGTETIFESLKLIRAIAVQELNELEGTQ